jgi:hypothetical protein
MYWCVRGSHHVLVCEGYRSCIGVGGVSIMYWCGRGIDFTSMILIFELVTSDNELPTMVFYLNTNINRIISNI